MLHLRHGRRRRELPVRKPWSRQRVDDRERHGCSCESKHRSPRPLGPRSRDETAREEEQRAAGRDIVPVLVDDAVHEEGRDSKTERETGWVAPCTTCAPECTGCRGEIEEKPDEPRLGQELQRHVVRLIDYDGRASEHLIRLLERPGSGASARMSRKSMPRLLPPHPPVALCAPEPRRRVDDLRVAGVRELVPDTSSEGDAQRDGRDCERERGNSCDSFDSDTQLRTEGTRPESVCTGCNEPRAREHDERENPPVVGAYVTWLAVARNPRQCEGNPKYRRPDATAQDEHPQALHPATVEQDPGRGEDASKRDAEARVRQEERDD